MDNDWIFLGSVLKFYYDTFNLNKIEKEQRVWLARGRDQAGAGADF